MGSRESQIEGRPLTWFLIPVAMSVFRSRLDIRAFGKWVGLIPKARRTIKRAAPQQTGAPEQATGRVDITDELRRYVLYRFTNNAAHDWFLDDIAMNSELQPLTPERFEAVLLSYFQ